MFNKFCYLLLIFFSTNSFAGDKATTLLKEYQLNSTEIDQVIKSFSELSTVDIATSTKTQTEENKSLINLYAEDSNDVYQIEKNEDQIIVQKIFLPFEVFTKTIEGEIKGTLYETILKDLKNEKIATKMSEAFEEDFTTTKGLKLEAHYSFTIVEYFDKDKFVRYGDIQKAQIIIGKALSERILIQDTQSLKWKLSPVLLKENEKPFYAPVKMSRVSSLFNLARRHPVKKRRIQPHNGIDFVARSGVPVFPALEGEIVAMGRARAKGKYILIQHQNGLRTTYDHLRKFKKGLHVGMKVDLNEQIGEVGRTGYATGAHLHFGVIKDGFYINPLYLVKDYTYDQKAIFEVATEEELSEDVADTSDSEF